MSETKSVFLHAVNRILETVKVLQERSDDSEIWIETVRSWCDHLWTLLPDDYNSYTQLDKYRGKIISLTEDVLYEDRWKVLSKKQYDVIYSVLETLKDGSKTESDYHDAFTLLWRSGINTFPVIKPME